MKAKKRLLESLAEWVLESASTKDNVEILSAFQGIVKSCVEILISIAIIGPMIGYGVLFVYFGGNGIQFFDGIKGIGLEVAVISIVIVFIILLFSFFYLLLPVIRKMDRLNVGLLKLLGASSAKSAEMYRGLNSKRFCLLYLGGATFYSFVFLISSELNAFDFWSMLFAFTVTAVFFVKAVYYFYFKKRIRRNRLYKDWEAVFFGNLISLGTMLTTSFLFWKAASQASNENWRAIVSNLEEVPVASGFLLSFIVIFFLSFNAVRKLRPWAFSIILLMSLFLLLVRPGLFLLSKNVIAQTRQGGDIPITLLLKDSTACEYKKELEFDEVLSDLKCQQTNSRSVDYIRTKQVFLTWLSGEIAYVKASENQPSPYRIPRTELLSFDDVWPEKNKTMSEPQ